jgi:hypothetical protein
MKHLWFVLLVASTACTSLGPMPATTAVSAVPTGRPGFEAQGGFVPAFYLSRSAQDRAGGAMTSQLSGLVEPDRWLGLPGLVLGARVYGEGHDTPGEPYVGYRARIDRSLAIAGIAYATAASSSDRLASYHATRLGGEAALDAQLWAPSPWFALHAQASLAATSIDAGGAYCVDANGVAIDCHTDGTANTMVDGKLSGVFASASTTLALDVGRRDRGSFHGARIAVLAATGEMPLARGGVMEATAAYYSFGLTLTLGFGDER